MILRSLFLFLLLTRPVLAADVALVDDELGQAVLFENRGLCYALLPNHVASDKDRISLAVAEPSETGTAEIFWRDVENDLAMAFVEGGLSTRCMMDLDDLGRDLSARLQSTETGMIKSVHFGGAFFDRLGATLVDVDDTFVTVRLNEAGIDAEIMQGLSGALLSLAGLPAGIAIDAVSSSEARFLRLDRIASLIGRNLSANHPGTRQIPDAQTGLGFRVTSFGPGDGSGVIALEPGDLAEPWLVDWTGAPVPFEITLSNDAPIGINRIVMNSLPDTDSTPPRQIEIELDRGTNGNPYWTRIAAPDMSPTGVFDMTTGGTVARRVRITFVDVWTPGKPVRLDRLVIE